MWRGGGETYENFKESTNTKRPLPRARKSRRFAEAAAPKKKTENRREIGGSGVSGRKAATKKAESVVGTTRARVTARRLRGEINTKATVGHLV